MGLSFTDSFLLWASEALLLAFGTGLIRLWFAHMKLREELAREYMRREDLVPLMTQHGNDITQVRAAMESDITQLREMVERDMSQLKKSLEAMLGMVHEIRGSLHGIQRQ